MDTSNARLHYLRRGSGEPVILIHVNGSLIQDWLISGVFDAMAETHEVIAVDRPGSGYSSRPSGTIWTAAAQGDAIADAMRRLGVDRACVVGHSFGATVAAALAADHPDLVGRLVLLSGFFYPKPRIDSLISGIAALPVIGDLPRYTVSPLWARAAKPLMDRALFAPAAVTSGWKREFPIGLVARPFQLHSTAADGALMQQAAMNLVPRYPELTMPVTIVTGDGDKVIEPEQQSLRLHGEVPHSRLIVIPRAGHMAHHIAASTIVEAIRS